MPYRNPLMGLIAAAILAPTFALAASPADLIKDYSAMASSQQAGFAPSAERGKAFYSRKFGVSASLDSCASCHTDNPRQGGKHVVTGKPLQPMSPVVNTERFTDSKKVEKWFKRNCTEVVGRECTAAEKADFIQFLARES